MTPATREIVERLAKEAGAGSDMWLIGIDEIERFWSLAMEHAAGIADAESTRWGSAVDAAAAIREAGK